MSDQWGNSPQGPQDPGETPTQPAFPQYGQQYPGAPMPQGGYGYPGNFGPPRNSKLAVTSLVLGIVSLPAIVIGIGPLIALVGLILGIIGVAGARRKNLKRGIGIAGIIVSVVSLIAGALLILAATNAANSCKSVDRNDNSAYTKCVKDHLRL